jgi:hypothetical protein
MSPPSRLCQDYKVITEIHGQSTRLHQTADPYAQKFHSHPHIKSIPI